MENIDTVASLGLEEKFYSDFNRKIEKPYRLDISTCLGVSWTVSENK